jgi:PAS domain S-box-containing protein
MSNDLTERKRATETLRELEHRLTDVIDFLPDATFAVNIEGKVTAWNRAIEDMTGISKKEMMGKCGYAYAVPFLGEPRPILIDLVLRDMKEIEKNYYFFRRNGDQLIAEAFAPMLNRGKGAYLWGIASPLYDSSSSIVGAIQSIRDITERKRAEEALWESEEKYRLLINTANESVVVAQDGLLKFVNPMTLGLLGADSEQELIDRPFPEFIHPDDRSMVVENYRRRITNEAAQSRYAFRVVTRDGIAKWVEINAALIEWQGKPATLNFLTDITERKRAEEALWETNEYLESLFNYANAPIIVWDPQFRITRFNHAFEHLTGRRANDIIGAPLEILFPPDLVESSIELIKRTLEGERWEAVEIDILHLDESVRTVLWNSANIYSESGDLQATIAQGQDITDRKQMEKALQESEERFRRLAENAPDVVFRIEILPEPHLSYISPAVTRYLDYTPEDFYANPELAFKLVHPDDLPQFNFLTKGEIQSNTFFIMRWLSKNGTYIWAEHLSTPVYDDFGNLVAVESIGRDITERKKVEEALKNSEREKAAVLSGLKNGSVEYLDPQMHIIWVNEAVQESLGISVKEMQGKYCFELIEGLKAPCPGCTAVIACKTGEPQEGELVTPDGKTWISCSNPLKDSLGQVTGVVHVAINITGRKRAEEALKESEQLFSSLVQHSAIATFVVNPEHKVLNWNKACEELTGVIAEEVIGTSNHWQAFYAKHRPCLADLIIDNKTEIIDELYEIHAKSKLIPNGLHAEGWYPGLGGKDRYILFDAAPIYGINGKLAAAIETLQDITERMLVEEELRKTRNYLENLIDYANAPIIVWDPLFSITRFNHTFERLTGLKADEVLGEPLATLFPESSREESMAYIRRTLSGEHWEVVEIPILSTDGSARTVLWNSANIQDKGGKVIATIAQGTDITERKRIEEELCQSRNELEQRVKGRTEELARKNAEMERFIYTVSHDLRTPLISVSGFLGFVEQDAQKGDLDRLKNDLRIANEAVTKMDRLLLETLELSRIGRVANLPEDVPFGEIVEDALGQTSERIRSKGCKVSVAQNLPVVQVDRMRIAEVLVNLIENNIKYTGLQANPEIEIGQRIDGEDRIFFVRDNGIGIEPSQHEKVFGLFYKVNSKSEGTGAGLAIVKRIIDVHGGRIWIESELGKGCTVCFTLPLADYHAQNQEGK